MNGTEYRWIKKETAVTISAITAARGSKRTLKFAEKSSASIHRNSVKV